MSLMSESRETTLKDSDSELEPRTKRDSFHWPKYSLIVGTITTSAVNASESAGCHASASAVPDARLEAEWDGFRRAVEDRFIARVVLVRRLTPTIDVEEPEREFGAAAPATDPILDKALEQLRTPMKKAA